MLSSEHPLDRMLRKVISVAGSVQYRLYNRIWSRNEKTQKQTPDSDQRSKERA